MKNKVIGMGRKYGDLYYLNYNPPKNVHSFSATACISDSKVCNETVWHYRLGHPSCVKTHPLNKALQLHSNSQSLFHCSVCHYAKQKKLPFISHHNIAENIFDLVHVDIWGPFNTMTNEVLGFMPLIKLISI
ncbi:hypothetical protein CsatA_010567 [Cannabis sativa]